MKQGKGREGQKSTREDEKIAFCPERHFLLPGPYLWMDEIRSPYLGDAAAAAIKL